MTHDCPKTVVCVTCDGEAKQAVWGQPSMTCYRCTECHAGGHIADDGSRHGGVFERLNNYATRAARRDEKARRAST